MIGMGWVLLIIVLVAAALGVLGAVLKIALSIILGFVLVVAILITVAWFGFKHWARDLQVRSQTARGTSTGTYEVRGWIVEPPGEDETQPPPSLPEDEA